MKQNSLSSLDLTPKNTEKTRSLKRFKIETIKAMRDTYEKARNVI